MSRKSEKNFILRVLKEFLGLRQYAEGFMVMIQQNVFSKEAIRIIKNFFLQSFQETNVIFKSKKDIEIMNNVIGFSKEAKKLKKNVEKKE